MKSNAVFLTAAVAFFFSDTIEARTWKEAGSPRTVQGDYARTEGDDVVISKLTGGTVKIPLAKLSEADQKFVAEKTAAKPDASKPEAAAAPAPDKDVFKWETDLEVAKKRAKDEKKEILADFTGSDWCGWCIKLKKEVFDTPEFQAYAAKNLIMLELDYPRKKELPAGLKEQNDKLAKEFQVQGFPTVVLMNSRGREVARTGYEEGGPEQYIANLKKLLK